MTWVMRRWMCLGTLAVLVGMVSCKTEYHFSVKSGETAKNLDNLFATAEKLAKDANLECQTGVQPIVHCDIDPALCNTNLETGQPRACVGLKPLFSFVHLTDAHIREESVLLGGSSREQFYDKLVSPLHLA